MPMIIYDIRETSQLGLITDSVINPNCKSDFYLFINT